MSVEFSVTGEAKDVARSAPQGLLSLKRVLEGGSSERQHLVGVERRSRTTEGTLKPEDIEVRTFLQLKFYTGPAAGSN